MNDEELRRLIDEYLDVPGDPNPEMWERKWIFVVCEDWTDGGVRHLKPITAFEPPEGVKYWERYR